MRTFVLALLLVIYVNALATALDYTNSQAHNGCAHTTVGVEC